MAEAEAAGRKLGVSIGGFDSMGLTLEFVGSHSHPEMFHGAGIFIYIWINFSVNVGKCSIHGASGHH